MNPLTICQHFSPPVSFSRSQPPSHALPWSLSLISSHSLDCAPFVKGLARYLNDLQEKSCRSLRVPFQTFCCSSLPPKPFCFSGSNWFQAKSTFSSLFTFIAVPSPTLGMRSIQALTRWTMTARRCRGDLLETSASLCLYLCFPIKWKMKWCEEIAGLSEHTWLNCFLDGISVSSIPLEFLCVCVCGGGGLCFAHHHQSELQRRGIMWMKWRFFSDQCRLQEWAMGRVGLKALWGLWVEDVQCVCVCVCVCLCRSLLICVHECIWGRACSAICVYL